MHTPETEREPPGLGETAKSVTEHASTLVRLELELAQLELKRKFTSLGIGIGAGAAAGLLLLYALGFGLASAAAGLATAVSTWLALLIVFVALVVIAGALGAFAQMKIKKGTPPVPEQALREAQLTTEALKSDGHDHV
jgi:hypothetical protein